MTDTGMARERATDPLALGALVTGGAALVAFIVAGFTDDILWVVGIALAVVGAILGWVARGRTTPGERSRMLATIGLVAAIIVIVWFLIFLIATAFD